MPLFGVLPACVLALLAAGAPAHSATLEEQRQAFREVYPAAERGEWEPVRAKQALLEDYALWPDLRAAYLRASLDDNGDEVQEFLDEHGTLKPARELRYRYALHLAAQDRHVEYLDIYRRWYAELGIAKLNCLALHAEILGGADADVAERAVDLWLVGRSQAEECDPVFDYLRGAGILGEKLYRQRFELAIAEQEFRLARYLARSLGERYVEEANRWVEAQADPGRFLDSRAFGDDDLGRRQVVYAIERLAYRDAALAAKFWERFRAAFPGDRAAATSRHIALWLARQHDPSAYQSLGALPSAAVNDEVRRWLVRSALRRHAWTDVIAHVRAMPGEERNKEEWQYWLAVALEETGDAESARQIFAEVAGERSYYGFLAADALGADYAFSHSPLREDDAAIARLARIPALIRARELFHVGLESSGRSEWDAAVGMLQAEDKVQAALLAHRWNWHSRAIATAASVDHYDDLEIRYPLPFREQFVAHSKTADIPFTWAYGIARSESLFMPDIRSLAGAIGIMQLMPETGRRAAAEIALPYAGLDTLTDPDSNIRLGTFYLGKMMQRFGDNAVLATAAYNAGPGRVEKWLPRSERLDARIWIENIPYNETRGYVRRVLMTDAIFQWRLTGHARRLSDELGDIDSSVLQVADAATRKRDSS